MSHVIYQCRLCSHKVTRYDELGYDIGLSRIERHVRTVHPTIWDRLMREVYESLIFEYEIGRSI